MSEEYWLPAAIVLVCNTLYFFYCQCKKDNGLIDILWGLIFIIPIAGLFVFKHQNGQEIYRRPILVLACNTIWGLRLAIHIGVRHTGIEDYRYVSMRRRWT